jgi:predicted GNAT family N-acyltransferase
MTDEELKQEKQKLGAKYCWVDKRYSNNWRHIFLYSENQLTALNRILNTDGSMVDEVFKRVCNDDKSGKYSVEEIIDVYYGYQNGN